MIKKTLVLAAVTVGLMAGGGAALHALDRQPVKAVTPDDVAKALQIKAREATVAKKEAELVKQEAGQAQLQKDLDDKLARLAAMQAELKNQLAALKGAQRQEFVNLVKIYSAMSPTKVAPLLDGMDDGQVVKILRAMKPAQVAKIMPKLKQEKAVSVSQEMGLLKQP